MAAAGGGASETETLKKNITDQLDRLVKQLAECEEYKDDLEEEEYEQMKADTKEQLEEFHGSLEKISSGNMSLVSEFGAMRMAIQAAISQAFKTPEIISLFAKKQPVQLRLRLVELERDFKINKVVKLAFEDRKLEILTALKKLGDELSPEEQEFLRSKLSKDSDLGQFESAQSEIDPNAQVLSMVTKNIPK